MDDSSTARKFTSVFNDVLGPVMRGPSSSHTAGSYHIGRIVRQLLGSEPKKVSILFDREGSYGRTYVQQGVDLAFVTGIMGWRQTDEVFTDALSTAEKQGVSFYFTVESIPQADHPNYVILEVEGVDGKHIRVEAKSLGGGTFGIVNIDGCTLNIDGKSHTALITVSRREKQEFTDIVHKAYSSSNVVVTPFEDEKYVVQLSANSPLDFEPLIKRFPALDIRKTAPVYHTRKNDPPFYSAETMVGFALSNGYSLGEAVLEYEETVLGISEKEAVKEMVSRYQVMLRSVEYGLGDDRADMLLLEPMASKIMERVRNGKTVIGGIHARAAAAAMAAMHTCNSRGVVCAAPTGGAAGTLPGILTALAAEYTISDRQMALMLFAAGGIGLVLAIRGTFAAEVAGCQVEIGAAGAMGAAAVVEFGGGNASQACDAAAISFQNTMGSVCDLVQGMCELPCHTRNAAAASCAFTNADMIMGGYANPVNLDETIDAVYSSGLMLPSELRCTARGGLALAPSAQSLVKPGR